jgi:glycine/D-amino acid oxidase-like deaminating enzyme
VVLIEKEYISSGATGRSGAGISQQWGTEMNCIISKHSCEMFEQAQEELEYEYDIEFKQGGYLLLASTEKEREQFIKNIALQNSLGIESRLLTLEEAQEIVPFLEYRWTRLFSIPPKRRPSEPFPCDPGLYQRGQTAGSGSLHVHGSNGRGGGKRQGDRSENQ